MVASDEPSATPAGVVVGVVALLVLAVNTVLWCSLLFVVTFAKLLVPIPAWRRLCTGVLVRIAEAWVGVNSAGLALTQPTRWDVSGLEGLDPERSYLVLCNHQSGADIPVLQRVLRGRIPFLRFFLKKRLIWVPLLGQAWWALDFPFMERHSRELLERHPERRGDDLAATRRACARLQGRPVSILSFAEGTRFTEEKKARLGGTYAHLLPPKVGGLAFAVASMEGALASIVDVTIVYPHGRPTIWGLVSRQVPHIVVRVREVPVPAEWPTGDYEGDPAFRQRAKNFVEGIWSEKDAVMAKVLARRPSAGML